MKAATPASWKKGQSGNPGGRAPKTDDERAGEAYLRERTAAAAERLVELEQSDDEKIALGATVAHLKITLGTLERQAGPKGESQNPYDGWSKEDILTLARSKL